ncbi:MAG: Wzz/FepE/Etk N-terminal domain-containing protein, partial [Chloroflexia bacterium]
MELLHYWKVIQKSLWLVILIMVVVVGAAILLSLNEKPKYESSTQLLLNPTAGQKYAPTDNQLGAETLADSYTELLSSQSFGESVVKELPFSM